MPGFVKTKEDERLWDKAKGIAEDAGKKENWAYVTGIYKKMKGGKVASRKAIHRIAARWLGRTAKETAAQAYSRRSKEITDHIKRIQQALKKHAQKFKKEDRNWGYVGDLGHIADELKDLTKGW